MGYITYLQVEAWLLKRNNECPKKLFSTVYMSIHVLQATTVVSDNSTDSQRSFYAKLGGDGDVYGIPSWMNLGTRHNKLFGYPTDETSEDWKYRYGSCAGDADFPMKKTNVGKRIPYSCIFRYTRTVQPWCRYSSCLYCNLVPWGDARDTTSRGWSTIRPSSLSTH